MIEQEEELEDQVDDLLQGIDDEALEGLLNTEPLQPKQANLPLLQEQDPKLESELLLDNLEEALGTENLFSSQLSDSKLQKLLSEPSSSLPLESLVLESEQIADEEL